MTSKVKVKVTLVQALRLCAGCTAHRGSRGIALVIHDQQHLKGVRGQRHIPAAFHPRERAGSLCTEAGWAPGRVWTGAKNLAPTGIRSSDHSARSQSRDLKWFWKMLDQGTTLYIPGVRYVIAAHMLKYTRFISSLFVTRTTYLLGRFLEPMLFKLQIPVNTSGW